MGLGKTKFLLALMLLAVTFVKAQKKPNIIIILADDMGYSDLGCMGSEIQTPNLDKLASDGALFTHFYNTSRCTPSRGSIMTGLGGHQAGVGHLNGDWEYESYQGRLKDNAVTLAELLQPEGYRTIQVGKWHVGDERPYWPIDRGFERMYGIPAGGGVYFWPPHSKVGNRPVFLGDVEQDIDPETWFSTDAFTDYAMDFVEEAHNDERPFFMYLAYIAPHYPLQAWPKDIAKYDGVYSEGYDAIRNTRFAKQKELGIVDESVTLSPADYSDWNSLSDKDMEETKMEIYAAQIDNMDQNIGRLLQKLEETDELDNTIIMFLSDNGGCSSNLNYGLENVGTQASFVAYGKNWSNVSNTPYRRYKKEEHEGGILTPLIVHYPKEITNKGLITHQPAHISDIVPTCLELAEASYPSTFKGMETMELMGESFWHLISGGETSPERIFGWEHEGNSAIRQGKWKLVKLRNGSWELYDLEADPTELNDLKDSETEMFAFLKEAYKEWKVKAHVIDWPVKTTKSYEFESYKVTTDATSGSITTESNTNASGNALTLVAPSAAGKYAEFEMPIFVPGYYNFSISVQINDNSGKYIMYVNDEAITSEIDLYNSTSEFTTIKTSQKYFDAQMATIRIECTGKNDVSNGYNIGVDNVSMDYSSTETIPSNSEFEDMIQVNERISGSIQTIKDVSASSDKYLKLAASGVGQYAEYQIEVPQSGNYQVGLRFKKYSSRGQYKLFLNNVQVGDVVDQYGDEGFEEVDHGSIDLEAGSCIVRVEVAGKNDASKKYVLTLDQINIVPNFGTSINDGNTSDDNKDIFFYPNPASSKLSFYEDLEKLMIYDASGNMVKYDIFPGDMINVSMLEPGSYYVVAKTLSGVKKTGKLLIK